MSHVDILAKFLEIFPSNMFTIVTWEHYGPNAIKVGMSDGTEMIFAYFDERNWSLSAGAVEMSMGGRV
ncbi:MAG: hypothetical protein J6Q60_05680 [Bacteroidaceae bacterium]|nr:hypothetical protein [Bacteroidaceae bacterium]